MQWRSETAWMAVLGPHWQSGMLRVLAWCCGQSLLLVHWNWSGLMHAVQHWTVSCPYIEACMALCCVGWPAGDLGVCYLQFLCLWRSQQHMCVGMFCVCVSSCCIACNSAYVPAGDVLTASCCVACICRCCSTRAIITSECFAGW
jgi:hypothetical protein